MLGKFPYTAQQVNHYCRLGALIRSQTNVKGESRKRKVSVNIHFLKNRSVVVQNVVVPFPKLKIVIKRLPGAERQVELRKRIVQLQPSCVSKLHIKSHIVGRPPPPPPPLRYIYPYSPTFLPRLRFFM